MPLTAAPKTGHYDIVKVMLFCDINLRSGSGTPSTAVSKVDNYEVVKLLPTDKRCCVNLA